MDSLPVATCAPEVAAASPDVLPGSTLTAILNLLPSPAPTPEPTPTPTPEPTPEPTPSPSPTPNARPSLTALTVSTRKVSYDTGSYCPTAVKRVTFKVKASDASGIDGVTLLWRAPGAATYTRSVMSLVAGTTRSGTWQVRLDTTADGITKAGKLAFYAVATDTAGVTRRIPASGSSSITVAVCVNTGPTITSVSSSSGSTLYWDPLGGGCGATSTNITAIVKDIDGVKTVTVFWRQPGAATYTQSAMTRTAGTAKSGTWQTALRTSEMTQTGTLSWYIKAVDTKNKASQTKSRSITIRRCDSEATFVRLTPVGSYSCSSSTATITIATYANDPDQPEDGLKVVFYWTLATPPGIPAAASVSGQMSSDPTQSKGNYYRGTTASFNGSAFRAGVLTVHAVTTDKYHGTTTSSTSTFNMKCQ